jgi:uncharacterized membrane protein YccC
LLPFLIFDFEMDKVELSDKRMLEWVQKIQNSLADLHDPSGSHLHRAWKACLVGLLTALIIYFAPQVGQPIMVIAAMIFAHKTTGNTPRQQQLTMLRAALISVLGIGLLGCLANYLLLQAVFLVILSFLAQYAVRFGSQYNSTLTWILILVAIADNPSISAIPGILINVAIGFFLAFICFFGFFPYNPQKALEAMAKRGRSDLGNLLGLTIRSLNQHSRQTTDDITDLKRRIFSLLEAQESSLKQIQAKLQQGAETIVAMDRQLISTQQELFEAIVVLERALFPLKYSQLVSIQLQPSLQQLADHTLVFLDRVSLSALSGENSLQSNIEEIIQKQLANPILSPEDRVYLGNVNLASQTLLEKLNALLFAPEVKLLENSNPETSSKPSDHKPVEWRFDLNESVSRRSARTAIAVLIALIVEQLLNLPHGEWVAVSALIVSRDSVGNTFWKAQGRLLGTAFGMATALIFYALIFRHHTLLFVTAFITVFPYLYLRPSLSNYGYAKFFQQFAFICFLGSLRQTPSVGLLEWRAIDIAIGCVIGLTVALTVLPTWARPQWRQGLINAWEDFQQYFQAIAAEYQSPRFDDQSIQKLSRETQKSVYELNKHLEGRKHESIMSDDSLSQRLAVIQANITIYETLLYLSNLAFQSKREQRSRILPSDAQTFIGQITAAFEVMQEFIGTRFSPQLPIFSSRYRLPASISRRSESVNQPQVNFLLALNQLCEAIEQYGEIRHTYSPQQNQAIQTHET